MDHLMQTVLENLHHKMEECKCHECPKCLALMEAVLVLEQVPEWEVVSKRIELALLEAK